MLARFGLDRSTVALGLELRDDVVLLALIRENRRVVGLGYVALPIGAVVRGDVREPDRLLAGLADLLDELHLVRPPQVAVSLAPTVARPPQTVAAVCDAGARVHAGRRTIEAARRMASSVGELTHIESTPISLLRFARLAQPQQTSVFQRGPATEGRWTAQFHDDTLELELDPSTSTSATPTIGPDLGSLEAPTWGAIDLARDLRRTDTRTAETWAVPVGAAFGALGLGPGIDLAAALDSDPATVSAAGGWTIEQIQQAT